MTDARVPHSIGLILDGNRRWAREQGLPVVEGHVHGSEKVKEFLRWAHDAGVKEVILYAFSTENWNRAPEEVEKLLGLFVTALDEFADEAVKINAEVRFIGERERFSIELQDKMVAVEARTKGGTEGTLAVALSYGGRAEILAAVNTLLASGAQSVDENRFKEAMWSAGLADPDLIIRTGGEKRLSNFLPWQSVYSELFFTDTKLPAFTKEEFDAILKDYAERERRHGK
ncbi:polyprenyl diphosphate synthase [Candidatus Parcubacteria bacterium]|nr:polyprenyl diphosphate synthase [Candidatus Parcubacteria bacterium]